MPAVGTASLNVRYAMITIFLAALDGSTKAALLRLKVPQGVVMEFSLTVEREKPAMKGVLRQRVVVRKVAGGITTLECTLTGLSIDGKDRSADLRAVVTQPKAVLSWTSQAERSGDMTPIELGQPIKDVMPFIYEAGLYLCSFPKNPVKPGDSWVGSTTATGGCTTGRYRLLSFKTGAENLASIEVTQIALASGSQIGPMSMSVDLNDGIPRLVDYLVRDGSSGQRTHFVQKLESLTRPKD